MVNPYSLSFQQVVDLMNVLKGKIKTSNKTDFDTGTFIKIKLRMAYFGNSYGRYSSTP